MMNGKNKPPERTPLEAAGYMRPVKQTIPSGPVDYLEEKWRQFDEALTGKDVELIVVDFPEAEAT